MHPDLQAIIDADRAAREDVDRVRTRLDARHEEERQRLETERAHDAVVGQAALDAAVAATASASAARIEARRTARAAERTRRAQRAEAAVSDGIAAYLSVIRGAAKDGRS